MDILIKLCDEDIETVGSRKDAHVLMGKYLNPWFEPPDIKKGDKYTICSITVSHPLAWRNLYHEEREERWRLERITARKIDEIAGDKIDKLQKIVSDDHFGEWQAKNDSKKLWEYKNDVSQLLDAIVSDDNISIEKEAVELFNDAQHKLSIVKNLINEVYRLNNSKKQSKLIDRLLKYIGLSRLVKFNWGQYLINDCIGKIRNL